MDLLISSIYGEDSGSAIKLRKVNPQRPCTMLASGAVGQRESLPYIITPCFQKLLGRIFTFCVLYH